MTMHYVDNPEDAVSNMNSLVSGRIEPLEKIHNVYLSKIISAYGINRDGSDFRKKIREYLANYENQIRDDYLSAQDPETKREIEEIYREYRMEKQER